ncbi:threonine-phosphate decarboxylase CobD [Profundibacterium mesophilum]|uniref:threonine-phosphate decarboxylase n=1 Tax=Profundibacterium mesophilum KAUST100406-0324 TaxID=1037889 RepID=A0A921NP05_9RHOB|nr:threonine-phosphate decarboxylase CobD [Profundibacterium mesophilum]KAF0675516.1 Aminotransferase [Profundibacterium mesophilum KAUST100406-0324]
MSAGGARDHGGGVDAAAAHHGGTRGDWLDLSTGINRVPYPLGQFDPDDWCALPDTGAHRRLEDAARRFWQVPREADVLAAPGASALIARLPALAPPARVAIPGPTYNEHAAAFAAQGWEVVEAAPGEPAALGAAAQVLVHPNNPDGRMADADALRAPLRITDESFCDLVPERSLIADARRPGGVVLKSFGKFWGLAGIRLGFAIGDPALIAPLRAALGPWPVSGPALRIGTAALGDADWARRTRARLRGDALWLDARLAERGAALVGGTDLFRLYRHPNARAWHAALAGRQIWSRVFPYAPDWLRLGLPAPDERARLAAALETLE